jgi:hypothetical protein
MMRWLLGAVLLGVGCGPVSYVVLETREATRAVTEARDAGAAKLAPYEWTSAMLYLERSREVAGYARWQDALSLARRATALARAATARTKKPPAP